MGATFTAFGLRIESDFELPIAGPEPAAGPTLRLSLVESEAVQAAWSGAAGVPLWSAEFDDSRIVVCQAGVAGDHLFSYGHRATFHLSADGSTLLCAPENQDEPNWRRFVVDTALHCVALLTGFEALHASAVMHPRGVVAFVGPRGCGKTTIAAEFARRGCSFFSDDVLVLRNGHGRVLGHPGPAAMTMAADGPLAPDAVGAVIDRFDRDVWVSVSGASAEPAPLVAIFLLDGRRPRTQRTGAMPLRPSRLWLLPHALTLAAGTGRASQRAKLLAQIAAETPLYRLKGTLETTPAELADLVDYALEEPSLAVGKAAR